MTQSETLTIRGAKFIVTVDSERRIIRDGSIVVQGNRIVDVVKDSELDPAPTGRVIDASDMVVTPGFVNGHAHISYAHATRGIFPDDIDGQEQLANVFKLQSAMTDEEEYYTSLLAITELLKYGTTCLIDPGTTKYLDSCMQAYEESGCRIVTGRYVTDRPNSINLSVYSTDEALAITRETIEKFDQRLEGRVRAWGIAWSAALASPELLVGVKELADQYGTWMTLHHSGRDTQKLPTERLEELGVLGPNQLLSHMLTGISEAEIDCLVRTQTKVAICPSTYIKSGGGVTTTGMLPEMLAKGVTVGLGTDTGNNSNLLETMRAMYLIAVLYKDGRGDKSMIPAETALEMATIRGAQTLGLEDDIGSIEVGKKADLVLFDTKRPEWQTLFNPINTLVYNADGRSVHTVIVDGRIVVEAGKPLFVDEWELSQKVQQIGEDMLARTGVSFPSRWPVV